MIFIFPSFDFLEFPRFVLIFMILVDFPMFPYPDPLRRDFFHTFLIIFLVPFRHRLIDFVLILMISSGLFGFLFYFILFYFILFYFILFLFCFFFFRKPLTFSLTLVCTVLFYFILFCFALLCFVCFPYRFLVSFVFVLSPFCLFSCSFVLFPFCLFSSL